MIRGTARIPPPKNAFVFFISMKKGPTDVNDIPEIKLTVPCVQWQCLSLMPSQTV